MPACLPFALRLLPLPAKVPVLLPTHRPMRLRVLQDRSKPVGLKNLGNTCYVNSVLQVGTCGLFLLRSNKCPSPPTPASQDLPQPLCFFPLPDSCLSACCFARSACLPTEPSAARCTRCGSRWRMSRLSRSCGERCCSLGP